MRAFIGVVLFRDSFSLLPVIGSSLILSPLCLISIPQWLSNQPVQVVHIRTHRLVRMDLGRVQDAISLLPP
jgi:hypothetical protein